MATVGMVKELCRMEKKYRLEVWMFMLFAWVEDHCLLGYEGSRMEKEV